MRTLRPLPFRLGVPRTFQALRGYNYRLYYSGLLISLTGNWMQTTAQAWLVLDLTDSPLALGSVIALQFLPYLLFSLPAGVIVDRFPKQRLIVVTQALAMIQALVLAALVFTGAVEIWHVYVLAGLLGLNNSIDNPARQSFLSELVSREDLTNAVALNSTLFNSARIVGPSVGGLLIAVAGVGACFLVNGLSYLAVLAGLLLMRRDLLRPAINKRAPFFRQIGEGLGYVRRTPDLLLPLLLMTVIGMFGYNFTVALPLLARYSLDANPVEFGAMTSAMGFGSLIGALVVATLQRTSWRVILWGAAGFSLLEAGVALSRWYVPTLLLLAFLGLCGIAFTTGINTTLQLNSTPEFRGRVMSLYVMVFGGSTPIGGLITGGLADRAGIQATLLLEATICAAAVAAVAWWRHHHATHPAVVPDG